MRILWWQESFALRGGGLSIVAQSVLRGLRECGDEIAIVTAQAAPEAARRGEWEGIPLWRFPFWQTLSDGSIDAIRALRGEIEELYHAVAPDVVHLHGFGPSALFHLESTRVAPLPYLLSLHSSNTFSDAHTALARQLVERANWVTACSRWLLDAAIASAPAIATRASVVYNGADPPPLAPAPLPREPRLLCVGDLAPHKGFDLVVRALPLLRRRFPRLRLGLAGTGTAAGELRDLARELAVGDAVELHGAVPHADVPALMNTASVVVVPSRRETFSMVALEAALMARPVVAAREGGLPEVVVHGETGLLVEPESPAALAAAIESLLVSPATAARLGEAARRRAQRELGVQPQVDAYRELHRRIVASAAVQSARRPERACE